ncbi:S8 family serine peptidase [Sphaerimonospora thailandensis]|uniref:Peptidase S8/S53 domain-containing protein n=1 Tax=Sphaerimonospora thailandensis TaxID=795644 RepID=A0A8J3VYU0_9ACTN|nr:S8 family serine peptidase [Sphaerimonospora thailandensis]GIH69335.1 hypothetical protein Mth01_15880 [Sphaerimonospora thailandensis]
MLRRVALLGIALWAVPVAVLPPLAAGPAAAEPGGDARRWAMDAVNAPAAWRVTKGSGVTVALLGADRPDEGVPELRGRVTQGPDMTGLDRADGAYGDGPVGRDGTAIASLIAGSGRGGGISGVAPEARVLVIPVVARETGQPSGGGFVEPDPGPGLLDDTPFARGIRFAANQGAAVIFLPAPHYGVSRAEREAVSYALSRGVVLVASVGDGGRSEYARRNGTSYWRFPAGYPGVVGVAAVDRQGRGTPESSDNLSALVAAPGAGVPVAVPGGGSGTASGTGMAGAIVAGTAALIKAKYPDMPPELVSRALTSTSRPHPRAGYDDKVGFGVVDAAAALTKAGELRGYARTAGVRDDAHFGGGRLSGAPERPGPDPVRLWVYGIAAALGVVGFGVAVGALARR